MIVKWRRSAIESIQLLDRWRNSIELLPIGQHLKDTVELYFEKQDFTLFIPGRQVMVRNLPVDLRMVLVSVGKSDPYKIFYRLVGRDVEVFFS